MKRRSFLQTLLASLALPQLAWADKIVAVRVWPAQDYTRITIEADHTLLAQPFTVPTPPRLAVDIDGLTLSSELRDLISKIKPDDPYVAAVRVGQFSPNVVRIVLDLKQEIRPEVFTLAPAGPYQYRLVMDLYPIYARDPLEALIAQRLNEKPTKELPLASDSNDPISNLIAEQKSSSTSEKDKTSTVIATTPQAIPLKTNKAAATKDDVSRLIIVALDPGHGGEDPGAIGPGGTQEKVVVLQIAKRVMARLEKYKQLRVYLTRDDDFFVPLDTRVQKARRIEADLFVSIHADAFFKPEARGASVFVLSEKGASSASARWMANKENASDVIGGVNTHSHDSEILRTLLDLSTTAQIKDSQSVGKAVLTNMGSIGQLHSARIEYAGFAVLKAPDIPSILVETAFISNPAEEALLNTEEHQERVAEAIANGIVNYFAKNPPLAKRRRTT